MELVIVTICILSIVLAIKEAWIGLVVCLLCAVFLATLKEGVKYYSENKDEDEEE